VDELAVEINRVVERLRSMPLTKLAAPWPPFPSRVAGARALAQQLADAAADASGEPHRVVPDVGDAAVGDQIAVTGADALAVVLPDDVVADLLRDVRDVRIAL